MLAYTLNRLLTQQAVIQRDIAAADRWGGDEPPVWTELARVPCRHWWAKASGSRSPNKEYATPSREVPLTEGGMLLPLGTDVTEQDRISQILDRHGNVLIDGLIEIVAVVTTDTHVELSILRAHLGG